MDNSPNSPNFFPRKTLLLYGNIPLDSRPPDVLTTHLPPITHISPPNNRYTIPHSK